MGTQMNEHGPRWEEQREHLSAYIDGRLTPVERSSLERHMLQCARCTAEVTELRQVVAVLGAMPAPRLPRSFTLPVTAVRETSAEARTAASGQARRGAPAWTNVARWAGGLAAAAGFVLLVGSGLVGLGGHMGGASVATSSHSLTSGSGAASTVPHATDRGGYGTASPSIATAPSATGGGPTQSVQSTTTASGGAGVVQPTGTTSHPLQNDQGGTGFSIEPLDLPLAGAGLLVVGATAFAAGSVGRRRGTPLSR